MKTLAICLACLSLSAFGFAQEKMPEIEFRDITTCELEGKFSPFIVHVEAGDELPLDFNLSGSFIAFAHAPENGKVVALQPFFIKVMNIEEGTIFFSKNKKEWKTPGNFFGGNLSISTKGQEKHLSISLDLNQK